jgi:hypothetical protein
MKRDMDAVRRIVLAAAALPYGEQLNGIDGMPEEVFITHVSWMNEAGLVKAISEEGSGSGARYAFVFRLTWAGCEFADAVASDTIWARAKDKVLKPGMSFTFDLLKEWLKAEIKEGFPTAKALS